MEKQQYLTKRFTIPEVEEIIGVPYSCLDHGHLILIDYMGGDKSIVDAARVSYQIGTKAVSDDRTLLRYLMRHRHTTPFEMVEVKFRAKMPIFVARQWIRHRTANINEESARYSILEEEFYIPAQEDVAEQSKSNRQGRGKEVPAEYASYVINLLREDSIRQYEHYQEFLNEDYEQTQKGRKYLGRPKDLGKPMIARELARVGLTLNFYTSWYWKSDLHNILHFLSLRMDTHAQKEIRVYANAMAEIIKKIAPFSYEAFEDYTLNATTFSRLEMDLLKRYGFKEGYNKVRDVIASTKKEQKTIKIQDVTFSRGELIEFRDKLEVLVS